jgi:TorA maturation chaperone TorD
MKPVPHERKMSDRHLQPVPAPFASEQVQKQDGRGPGPADRHRAEHYTLLAVLLSSPPSDQTLDLLAALSGDDTRLGRAYADLAAAACTAPTARVGREHFNLFIGVGRGELLPYGSFYQTGFLQEKPLARLRQDLVAFGMERSPKTIELEDHISVLCETMAILINGCGEAPEGADRLFFRNHLAPWATRFFADLETAEAADFYRRVGRVGREFLTIETDMFALAA